MLKKHLLSKIIEIKGRLDVCDIQRIRNFKAKSFTFRQQNYSDYIKQRLNCIFVLQNLQELVKTTEMFNAFSSDHSPVFCYIFNDYQNIKKGKCYGNLITHMLKEGYVLKLTHFVQERLQFLNANIQFSYQMKWEYTKFEIRNFAKSYEEIVTHSY